MLSGCFHFLGGGFLFPVCFFWCFWTFARIDYQYFTISKQILKKKIMEDIGEIGQGTSPVLFLGSD